MLEIRFAQGTRGGAWLVLVGHDGHQHWYNEAQAHELMERMRQALAQCKYGTVPRARTGGR